MAWLEKQQQQAVDAVSRALSEFLVSRNRDHRDAMLDYFHLKSLILALLSSRFGTSRDTQSVGSVLGEYARVGVLSRETLRFFEQNATQLRYLVDRVCDIDIGGQSEFGPGDFYQSLLTLNLAPIDGHRYLLERSKHARDVSGSYYTPANLAWETTRRAMDLFVETAIGVKDYSFSSPDVHVRAQATALLAESSVADLSCGSGEFLLAAFRYARDYSDVGPSFIGNLWGIDIDPIALMICHAELTRMAQCSDSQPAAHLILGNPLYINGERASFEEKCQLYALGRVYAKGMALEKEELPHRGFDLIVGNPPWEKVRFEERKFFALAARSIATEHSKAAREQRVTELALSDPELYALHQLVSSDYSAVRTIVSDNPFISALPPGELNTYSLFPILGRGLLTEHGVLALILKSAIATSPVNASLFQAWCARQEIQEIHFFENSRRIFPIDAREKFCVLVISPVAVDGIAVSFGNVKVLPLNVTERTLVTAEELAQLNPDTRQMPCVTSTAQFRLLSDMCGRLPVFRQVFPRCHFGRLLHLTLHAAHISRGEDPDSLPILEGKFIGQHDLRFATFDGVPLEQRYVAKAKARRLDGVEKLSTMPASRYFVEREFWSQASKSYRESYMLCWRSLTSATNNRTTIAALAPFSPAIQSIQFLQTPGSTDLLVLAALFNSTVFDYLVRLKIPGIDLTQSVIQQIPVPSIDDFSRVVTFDGETATLRSLIEHRVAALYDQERSLEGLVGRLSSGRPDPTASREELIDEIDALIFEAYGLDEDLRREIADHFDVAYRDEDHSRP